MLVAGVNHVYNRAGHHVTALLSVVRQLFWHNSQFESLVTPLSCFFVEWHNTISPPFVLSSTVTRSCPSWCFFAKQLYSHIYNSFHLPVCWCLNNLLAADIPECMKARSRPRPPNTTVPSRSPVLPTCNLASLVHPVPCHRLESSVCAVVRATAHTHICTFSVELGVIRLYRGHIRQGNLSPSNLQRTGPSQILDSSGIRL